MTETKRCTKCDEPKPLDQFYRYTDRRARETARRASQPVTLDGRRSICKACFRQIGSRAPTYRQDQRERVAAKHGKRYRTKEEMARAQHDREYQRRIRYLLQTLQALLTARCYAQGHNPRSVRYAARWKASPEFRESECQRQQRYKHSSPETAARYGDRRKRRIASQSDGTLTHAVLRRLFATATTCPYCGDGLTSRTKALDHMHPVSRGGAHSVNNVVVCCRRCNLRKRDTPYLEWLARLSCGGEAHSAPAGDSQTPPPVWVLPAFEPAGVTRERGLWLAAESAGCVSVSAWRHED